jgi:uncharacterized protein (DUF1330 family)
MEVNNRFSKQLEQLVTLYGDGGDGTCPTPAQWTRILNHPEDQPLVLINMFKLRDTADYEEELNDTGPNVSGEEAFGRYAAVSMPTMERVGGQFLHVGPAGGTFLGEEEDWDIIAIGRYPNVEAFLGLYTDPAYQKAFSHRTAACARQEVHIGNC